MRRFNQSLNAGFLCVFCLGCTSETRVSEVAYLTVIDSMARTIPLDSPACFASGFYPDGRQALPGPLRDSLLSRGWALHDPLTPFDTGAVLVYVAEARSEEGDLSILVGFSGVHLFREELSMWGEDRVFRLTCEPHGCRVTGVEDRSHWDGTVSREVSDYLSEGRETCQGAVPSPPTEVPG